MPVSSNSLFHFTNNYEHLLNILKNNFRPHYSLENFNTVFPGPSQEYLELAIPMVCFCDIPLSQIREHISTYGCYGIGLTKEWGKRKGITPVTYTYPDSLFSKVVRELMQQTQPYGNREYLYDLARFIKPYNGSLWRSDGEKSNVTFYNEREWRFIPLEHTELLSKADFLNEKERKKQNEKVTGKYKLTFTPDDIRYVIVNSEDEILKIIHDIEEIKSKFTLDQVKILTTRIITSERIKEDL